MTIYVVLGQWSLDVGQNGIQLIHRARVFTYYCRCREETWWNIRSRYLQAVVFRELV